MHGIVGTLLENQQIIAAWGVSTLVLKQQTFCSMCFVVFVVVLGSGSFRNEWLVSPIFWLSSYA